MRKTVQYITKDFAFLREVPSNLQSLRESANNIRGSQVVYSDFIVLWRLEEFRFCFSLHAQIQVLAASSEKKNSIILHENLRLQIFSPNDTLPILMRYYFSFKIGKLFNKSVLLECLAFHHEKPHLSVIEMMTNSDQTPSFTLIH